MRPSIGTEIAAELSDDDGGITGTTWQWASADAMIGPFTNIDGETSASYITDEGDVGKFLQATASYTDAEGSGKSAKKVTASTVQQLAVNGPDAVTYEENGTTAVGTYTASGGSMSDMAALTLMGNDAGDFMINGGMLTFNDAPDFEAPADADGDNTYMVTVMASAGGEMDTQDVMVMVTNVDEMGEVTLWAGMDALTMAPQVGDTITGAVMDPDGGPGRCAADGRWTPLTKRHHLAVVQDHGHGRYEQLDGHPGHATDAAYMVTAGNAGYYLRVMATYTDAAGTDMDGVLDGDHDGGCRGRGHPARQV